MRFCFLPLSAFVDALSAPIQFMSQAEKRAKQMQDMGIDESDISDVPASGSKKQKNDKRSTDTETTSNKANSTPQNKPNNGVNNEQVKEKRRDGKGGFLFTVVHSNQHQVLQKRASLYWLSLRGQ